MSDVVRKQTKPTFVEGKQFTGGSENGMTIVDWVRQNKGEASWKGSYQFSSNSYGTGQKGWTESLRVVTYVGANYQAAVGTWVIKDDLDRFEFVSSVEFVTDYMIDAIFSSKRIF